MSSEQHHGQIDVKDVMTNDPRCVREQHHTITPVHSKVGNAPSTTSAPQGEIRPSKSNPDGQKKDRQTDRFVHHNRTENYIDSRLKNRFQDSLEKDVEEYSMKVRLSLFPTFTVRESREDEDTSC